MSTEPASARGLVGSRRFRLLLRLLCSLQRTWPDFRGCTYDPVTRTLDLVYVRQIKPGATEGDEA